MQEEEEVKKKKRRRSRRSRRAFYEKQIVQIHRAMRATSPETKEYKKLYQMEQKMQKAKRQYETHIDWPLVLEWCKLAADVGKVIGIGVIVVCLAEWMYSEDEQLKMKNGSVRELLSTMLRTLTMMK